MFPAIAAGGLGSGMGVPLVVEGVMIARLQKLSTQIDQAKLATASANIGAWVQKNCTTG